MKTALPWLAALLLLSSASWAAEPSPTVAITHARVYVPGGKPPLENATVILAGGKVTAVGVDLPAPADAKVIDGHGKVVTPGFIDVGADVGVVDVALESASSDIDTQSPITPAMRMIDAYNPRSAVIPVTRARGVTSVVLSPRNGLLCGQSAFVDLTGDTIADAVVRPILAQRIQVDDGTAQWIGGTRGTLWRKLREVFDDARFYATHRGAYDSNAARKLSLTRLELEALVPVVRGEEPLVVWAHRASDIETVLAFADALKLKVILEGASEAWMLADDLAKRRVPVIVDPLENLPSRFDRLHARSDNAAILARAGVPVILSTFSAHEARLLWQRAGNAVRLGMDHEAAIQAITETPAVAFGLKGYGRIEKGAVGNIVVWSGDPLQTSTRVEHVYIRGREESLVTRQTLLLDRYRTLPFTHDGSR